VFQINPTMNGYKPERSALGAENGHVVWMAMKEALLLAAIGIAIG